MIESLWSMWLQLFRPYLSTYKSVLIPRAVWRRYLTVLSFLFSQYHQNYLHSPPRSELLDFGSGSEVNCPYLLSWVSRKVWVNFYQKSILSQLRVAQNANVSNDENQTYSTWILWRFGFTPDNSSMNVIRLEIQLGSTDCSFVFRCQHLQWPLDGHWTPTWPADAPNGEFALEATAISRQI